MKPTGNLSLRRFCLLLLMLVSYTDTYVLAAPRGGHVVSGSATFQQDGNLTTITAGNRSVINYGSFNIAPGETVRFVQPGANSSVLNRVVGSANPTEIFGTLQANGHVYIANPYGIFFRNGSVINVGGLYAGAGNLSDADFTKGKIHFTDLAGDVRNDGIILANDHLALMGVNVVNNGTLRADTGVVMMVSGKDVYVGEKNSSLFVRANGNPSTTIGAAGGSVVNRGTVAAPRVLLGGGDLYSTAIANSGLLQGRSVVVNAGRNGTATVSGTVDASSAHNRTANGAGGSIQVLGGTVALNSATLDASGATGGGSVRVGGDFHGGGTLATAATTTVDAATTIKADAMGANGNGGTVVLWSDETTRFAGQISARGGTASGNGGSVEVSSHDSLMYAGLSDLRSPTGKIGSLLLDPHNVTIVDGASTGPSGDTFFALVTPDANATITTGSLSAQLNFAGTTLQANNDIIFSSGIVTATANTSNLTLEAGRSITFGANTQLNLLGSLNATFNDQAALAQYRDMGAAVFSMATGSQISAPGGVTIQGGTLAQYTGGPGVGLPVVVPPAINTTVNANTGNITLQDISTVTTNPTAAANPIPTSGGITVNNNANGVTSKGITVNGTLLTSGPAANANNPNTAAGDIALTASGALGVNALTASGTGTGAGGTITLSGNALAGSPAVTLGGAITGGSLGVTARTTNAAGVVQTTTPGQTLLSNGTITTNGADGQVFDSTVVLGAAGTLKAGAGPITFDSTVGSVTTPQALTATTTGLTKFTAPVGGTTLTATAAPVLASVSISGPAEIDATSVTTTGNQSYGTLTLGGTGLTTLSSTGNNGAFSVGAIAGAGHPLTVNGANAGTSTFAAINNTGALNFTLGSVTAFNGPITATSVNFVKSGVYEFSGGSVTTSAGQTYGGSLAEADVLAPLTLSDTGKGNISLPDVTSVFTSRPLTINTGGTTTFNGTVGALGGTTVALSSLTVGAAGPANLGGTVQFSGGSITTNGAGGQVFNDKATLGAATTLNAGAGPVTFAQTIANAGATAFGLSVNSTGAISFGGAVGTAASPLSSLATSNTGAVALGGGSVTTSGVQNYGGQVTLGTDTTLKGSTLTLAAGLLGAGHDLTLNFSAAPGATITSTGTTAITGIRNFSSIGAGGTSISGKFLTTGSQNFGDALTLTGDTTLQSSGGGAISFLTVDSHAGDLLTYALTVNTTGNTTFGGTVGGTTPLSSLTTDGTAIDGTVFTPGGTTFFTSTGTAEQVTTDTLGTSLGAQTYNDAVVLSKNTTLQSSLAGLALLGGPISFARTVDGPGTLSLNTTGGSTFHGAVGESAALGSLSVTGPATFAFTGGLPTTAATASIITTGDQIYSGAVTLSGNAALLSTGGNLTFSQTIDGGFGLSASAKGNETFGGLVGASTALLSMSTDAIGTAGGTAIFQSGGLGVEVVRTSGAGGSDFQTYNDSVQLQQDATFQSGGLLVNPLATAGGNITFNGKVDGLSTNGQSLTVNTAGVTTFGGLVGSTAPLRALTTDKESGTGEQTRFTMTLPTATNNVAGVNVGTGGVTINDAMVFQVANSSSAKVPLNVSGVTGTNNPSVTSTGPQNYLNGITLQDSTVLQGSTLNFAGGIVGGGHDLTLDFSGTGVVVPGTITTGTGIRNFASVGSGGTQLDGSGGSFQTTGYQYYGNAVTLLSNTILISGNAGGTNAGNIGFGNTVKGAFALTLDPAATGRAIFAGIVGGGTTGSSTDNLASLTVNGDARIASGGGFITTSGPQKYTGNLTLDVGVTLASTGDLVTVGTLTGSGHDLTVAATGSSFGTITSGGNLKFQLGTGTGIFSGAVNAISLATTAGETDLNGGAVTTTGGGQSYTGPVVIKAPGTAPAIAATALTDNGGGSIRFSSTLAGDATAAPQALTLTTTSAAAIRFAGAVSGFYSLGTVGGTADINGGAVTTTGGGQTYGGAVLLGSTDAVPATVLADSANGNIAFDSTLDGATGTAQALTVNTGGLTQFGGLVGSQTALASLTTDNEGVLNEATQLNMAIGTAAQGVNVSGDVMINDAVRFAAAGSTLGQPTVRTGGSQAYNGGGSATQNTALVGGGTLNSMGGLDFGGNDLSVSFGGQVTVPGAFTGVRNFISNGMGGTLINDTFTTTGSQTYGDAVALANTPVLNAVGNITFNSTVDGNVPLTLNVTGANSLAVFKGLVGNGTTLLGLTTSTTGGTQFLMDAGSADANKGGVNVDTGGVSVTGPVLFGALHSTTAHPTVFSVGAQSYNGAATLGADTVLVGTGDITFGSTVDGVFGLSASSAGNEVFKGLVGGTSSLTALTTDEVGPTTGQAQFSFDIGAAQAGVRVNGPITLHDAALFDLTGASVTPIPGTTTSNVVPSVLTLGGNAQTYDGIVTLGTRTVFASTAGTPTGTVFTGGGQITFNSSITSADAANRQSLYVRTDVGPTSITGGVNANAIDLGGAKATFQGLVGPVDLFSVESNAGTGGSVAIGGSITTSGAQTYNAGVILPVNSTFTAGGNIVFNSTVDSDSTMSPRALTLNTAGLTIFNNLVGNTAPLLSLTTDNQGVAGEGTQFNMNLTGPGIKAGVSVVNAVTINDPVTFNAVGSSLTVPTILTGVNGGTGSQTYASAATLKQDTVLTDLGTGDITFGSTIDGGFNLYANTGGDEVFGGLIGGNTPLASLQTDLVGPRKGAARFNMTFGLGATGVNLTGALNIQDGVVFNALASGGTQTIITGGAQTFLGVASVLQTASLQSKGGILFNSAVDGPGGLSLSETAGNIQFNAPVGAVTPLASLFTNTPTGKFTLLNAGQVTTVGSQTYGPLLLGKTTTLTANSNAGDIVAASIDGGYALTLSSASQTIFFGAVGGATPLASLTVLPRGGVTRIEGGQVITTGAQTYGDPVQIGLPFSTQGVATLQSNARGNITFGSTVDAGSLTANTGGLTIFNGLVGGTTPLNSLTTDNQGAPGEGTQFNLDLTNPGTLAGVRVAGAVTINDPVLFNAVGSTVAVPTVRTGVNGGAGSQMYAAAVTLARATVLADVNTGAVVFSGTMDGPAALTVNTAGATEFDGLIGGMSPLASLTTDAPGTTRLNAGQVFTTGAQIYGDAVTLARNTTLVSTGNGDLRFGQTLDGAFALTLNTGGLTLFGGAVGGATPLASVTTDAPGTTQFYGGSVSTSGAQTYNDPSTLGVDTTLASTGGNILFANTLNSTTGTARNLMVNTTGRTEFDGLVGSVAALGSVTTDLGGVTVINGGGITTVHTGTTSGAQTYNDAVQLGANGLLTSLAVGTAAGGNLTFKSTVDGPFALTLNTGGLTIFDGVVGGTTALTGLTTDNAGAAGEGTQFNMAVGNATAGVVVNGAVQINDAVLFNVQGSSLTQPGILTLGDHGQAYNGPAALGTSTHLTSATTFLAPGVGFTGGGGIRFNSPAGIRSMGGSDLYVRSAVGTTSFASTINVGSIDLGGAQATFNGPINLPGTLSVLPNNGGTGGFIEFAGGGLTTAGAQTYRVGVILGADTVFTSLNTANDGANITFAGTVDSDSTATARALTLNTSGDEIFDGLVGSRGALASLTTDAPGPVGGTARFNMSLLGTPAGTAGVNVLGAVTINDAVNFNVAGSSLTDGSHPTISSGGAQTYNGAASLARNTALVNVGGGNLTFNSAVDGGFGLALSSAGDEVFNGLVGRQTALASLATDVVSPTGGQARFNMDTAGTGPGVNVAGAVTINDGVVFNAANVARSGTFATILSGGTQTYNGSATLARDAVLTSNSGNLVFNGTLDGPFFLTTNSGGVHAFNGLVGSLAPLASLTTNGGGTQFNTNLLGSSAAAGVRINGPLTVNGTVRFNVLGSSESQPTVSILGPSSQTYNGAATVAQNTVLRSTGGDLLFASKVDGPFTLSLETSGNTTLDGAVGSATPLASLTTNAGGATFLGAGSVVTSGTQIYGDVVTLTKEATLISTGGGALTFGSRLDGAFDLALNSAGQAVFDGPVGSVTPLTSLTTSANSTAVFNFPSGNGTPNGVLTTGAQTYNGALTLNAGTTLTSQNGAITAGPVTGNGANLTVNAATGTFGSISGAGALLFTIRGVTSLNGPITAASLAVKGGQSLVLNAGTTTTSAFQDYALPVTLGSDTQAVSTGSGNVSFDSTLDGGRNLTVSTAGTVLFGGVVGGTSRLASLTVAKGAASINGGSILTTGDQKYAGSVTLGAVTTLDAGKATIGVKGTLFGKSKALTVTASRATFGEISNVGDLKFIDNTSAVFNGAVVARSLEATGDAALNGGTVRTAGDQNYSGNVTLGATASLTSTDGMINAPHLLTGNGHDLAVAASDATFGQLDGTGATTFQDTHTTTLNGTVDAASLGVSGGQLLTLNAGRVTTSAFQDYAQPVVMSSDTQAISTSAGNVSFGSTLDGARNLTVDTVGTAAFGGAVGGTARLASLTVATGAASITGGSIQTTANQQYNNVVTTSTADPLGTRLTSATSDMIFNNTVTGNGGALFVQGHRVLMHGDTTINGGNLSLNSVEVPGNAVSALLLLDGRNYVSNGGNVILNAAESTTSSSLSTIVLTNTGTVNIRGADFTMGYQQKLFASGALNIDVGRGVATVGDLAARQTLRINAREIDLLNRPAGVGDGKRPNTGLNFVADQGINFGNATIQYTRADNQTASFITTSGVTTIQRRTGLSIFRDPNLDTQFRDAFTRDGEGFFLVDNPFQPVGGGSQTLDTAAAISGALPDQKPLDIPVDVTITASQMEELRKLGIHPRKAQSNEQGSLTARQSLFAQLADGQDTDNYGRLQPIKGAVSVLVPSDYVVVVNRMSEREVQAILQAFEQLYGKNKEKAPQIGAAYQKAFDEYTVAKQTADPAGFGPYLKENQGKYPDVDQAGRGFDNLFGYIEHMGLTHVEVQKAESYIVSDLNVNGPTPDDMVKVIDTQRRNLPPAQKAGSTKLPPAPPMAAPAPAPAVKKEVPPKSVRATRKDATRRTARQPKAMPKPERDAKLAGL